MTILNTWTPETLTEISLTRASGYNPGIESPRTIRPQARNSWTAGRFTRYAAALAKGYGPGI